MNTIPCITIEKDDFSNVEEKPEGWNDALTSKEFLSEMKKMMKKKFEDKHKIL